jgi:hypothetical protein
MSLVSPDLQLDPVAITVTVTETSDDLDGGSVTVDVRPRRVKLQPGLHTLQWTLKQAGGASGWTIASISGGGIAAQVNATDGWTSGFLNGLEMPEQPSQHFPYTIVLTKTYTNPTIVARIGVDPVIENDPPS